MALHSQYSIQAEELAQDIASGGYSYAQRDKVFKDGFNEITANFKEELESATNVAGLEQSTLDYIWRQAVKGLAWDDFAAIEAKHAELYAESVEVLTA